MAIELNSASWTGQESPATTQVCGMFQDRAKLDEAMSRLEGSRFQRADLATFSPGQEREQPAQREDDTRNMRTLGTSTATAATAMAAAGVVIATGGAALPAVAAAAAAGGATMAAGEAVGHRLAPNAGAASQAAADAGGVVLAVHAASPELAATAEEILRGCGATKVWRATGDRAAEAPGA